MDESWDEVVPPVGRGQAVSGEAECDVNLRAASAGIDENEFRAIYERHIREIFRYAFRCVGRRPVAEELVSEAFLRLFQNRDRTDPSKAAGWLMTTVKNLARDHWRKFQTEQKHLGAFEETRIAPAPPWNWNELLDHPSLKPEHRVCLTLKYVHGMDRKQIMNHTGMTENQVKSCIQYGLQLLRRATDGDSK